MNDLNSRLTTSERRCVYLAESLGSVLATLGLMEKEEIEKVISIFANYYPLPHEKVDVEAFNHFMRALATMRDAHE
jgi:GMP synthase PP-ATPase subunit